MYLFDTENEEWFEGAVKIVLEHEFEEINNSNRFLFDWSSEKENKIYKIYPKTKGEVLGLISINDIPEELRVHIELIEISKGNTGKSKKIENIAGCLIAFACKMAFEKGYGGFVSLIPKTLLIDHYKNRYGFKQFGRQLALEWESSKAVIQKYFDNEKI